MHYYQFNIADYKKDTDHLTPIEHYIYRTLIDRYYLDEKPIPKETQSVMRRLRLETEHDETMLKNVLSDFFYECEDGFRHERIEKEIELYHSKAERNRKNGAKGGRPPANKPKITQVVNSGITKESEANPNQEPLTTNQEPITNNNTQSKALSDKSDCVSDGLPVLSKQEKKEPKFSIKDELLAMGVDSEAVSTWLDIRKKKKMVNSRIALDRIVNESAKAGMHINQAVYLCCENSWGGFKAEWAQNARNTNQTNKPYTGMAVDDLSWMKGMDEML